MKDKLIAAFKQKYVSLGLDVKILEGLASQLEAFTSDETLDTVVNGAESLLKSFQVHRDKRVTDAVAKVTLEAQKPPTKPTDTPPTVPTPGDDTPEWVKALQGTIQGMASEIQTLKGNKVLTDRKSILEEKLKDAAPAFKGKILKDFARMNFENDDTFNEYLTETETDLAAFTQDVANQGLRSNGQPFVPTVQPTGKAAEADIEAWGKKNEVK